MTAASLRALVVDDEQPVLDELVWLLSRDDRIGTVQSARSGTDALRLLEAGEIDLVFLDIAMPGLSGLQLASLLGRFRQPPAIVFVTAHDAHAVEAFELNAADYLLKPIREERLRESVRRVCESDAAAPDPDATIAVELGGVTRFVQRSTVALLEAQGDYVRLHTTGGDNHLIRTPLSTLAAAWADAGFARVHRSHAVNLAHVVELRTLAGRSSVLVDTGAEPTEIQVARRHTRELRDLIHDRAR